MKKLILSKGMLLFVFLASVSGIAVQKTVADLIENRRTVRTATCTAQGFTVVSGDVALALLCDNQKRDLTSAKVIVSYLKNPGPLTCTVHSSGIRECSERE